MNLFEGKESRWMLQSLLVVIGVSLLFTGCSKDKKLQATTRQQASTIQSLNSEILRLNEELDSVILAREALAQAKAEMEAKLQEELEAGDVSLNLEDRGLVLTMLDRILFDSGKSVLKSTSSTTLDKVADILNSQLSEHMVYVEGHTDNIPIKYSSWKSNWELSTARATEVIHYFTDKASLKGTRLAAIGYGEFQPVDSNDTETGRLKNRRVEIVISPKKIVAAPVGAAV